MKTKMLISSMIFILSINFLSGCSVNKDVEEKNPPISEKQLYEEYLNLSSSEVFTLDDRIDWMNTNMIQLDSEESTLILMDFEEQHLEEAFVIMEDLYDLGFENIIQTTSIEAIEALEFETDSIELKEHVSNALSQGYKFVTVEGSFNVIIDYSFYDAYKAYVTEDAMTYYELMKTESESVPLKDAAIVIEWKELFDRTEQWEKFITEFPESTLYDRANQKLNWYLDWSFNGSPNTPVFEWDSKAMTDSYREGIESFLSNALPGEFESQMQLYYDMIKNNNFKQNDTIEEFQDKYKIIY